MSADRDAEQDDGGSTVTQSDNDSQASPSSSTPSGTTLPVWLLALKLLKAARLTREERIIIMTGLDFSKKTVYKAAVTSLKKFWPFFRGNTIHVSVNTIHVSVNLCICFYMFVYVFLVYNKVLFLPRL